MNKLKLLFSSYLLTVAGLFIYSFTQVDLSLTLSQASIYQQIQKQLQYIGFFQRPISALIFLCIMLLLFIFYFSFLYLAKKNKLKPFHLVIIILTTFIILIFSYNAFSYDLFNYIFDAKIVTHYQQNPYLHKATDFALDPMLNFMRWTQRAYPYGPTWLVLTVPLSFLSMKIFLISFFLFKTLAGITFLGSCLLIYKISEKLFPKNKVFNTVFFAFNPLVLIEGLVSAHNDFPMIFFALLAIYLFLFKKKIGSILSLLFSIGVKYSTAILVLPFLYVTYLEKKKKNINYEKFFLYSVILSLFVVVAASLRTTFQPWYLILTFSLAAFISRKSYIFLPVLLASVFSLLIYVVYVYMTDYAKPYPETVLMIESVGLIFVSLVIILQLLKLKFVSKIDR